MATSISELQDIVKDLAVQIRESERVQTQQMTEVAKRFKETEERFKETDIKFKETEKRFQDLEKRFQETDIKFQETDSQFRKTDKRIKEAFDLFTTQWGKLIESLVKGDLVKVLNSRGIRVQRTLRRVEGQYENDYYEFDIIAVNGDEIVIVEVKTTLRPEDVKKFIKKLEKARVWLHEYAQKKIYGCAAFLESTAESAKMAERQGLFVIKATGDSAAILNNADFKPKIF